MELKRYQATWTIANFTTRHTDTFVIDGEYSTVEDIPTMIACRNTGRQTDAQHVNILSVNELTYGS